MADSRLANLLMEGEAEILDDWERRARQALTAIAGTPRLILRNYLVDYVHRMAKAFDRLQQTGDPQQAAEGSMGDSAVHGQLRATTPAYDLRHVITEYRILREVVRDYLERQRPLSQPEQELLVQVTDVHITAAAKGFSESLTRLHSDIARRIGHSLAPALSDLLEGLRNLQETTGPDQALEQQLALTDRLLRETDALVLSVQMGPGQVLPMRFEEDDLRTVVNDVLDGARLAYGDRFELRAPSTPLEVRYSRTGIERMLENLIDNAVRSDDKGTRLRVELDEEGKEAIIRVHYRGNAFSDDERARLRAPFEGGADSGDTGEDWGLGLSLVGGVIRAHQGRIRTTGDSTGGCIELRIPKQGPQEDDKFLLAGDRELPANGPDHHSQDRQAQ